MNIWIVTSGELLKTPGVRSFNSAIMEIMNRTEKKFLMAVYVLRSEPAEFWNNLKKMSEDGVDIKIILDGSVRQDPGAVSLMNEMSEKSSNFRWRIFRSDSGALHAKLIVSDSYRAIIGSANITLPGLFSNHEIGVLLEDRELAWISEKLFMELWDSSHGV